MSRNLSEEILRTREELSTSRALITRHSKNLLVAANPKTIAQDVIKKHPYAVTSVTIVAGLLLTKLLFSSKKHQPTQCCCQSGAKHSFIFGLLKTAASAALLPIIKEQSAAYLTSKLASFQTKRNLRD